MNLHLKQQQKLQHEPSRDQLNYLKQIISIVEEERKNKSYLVCNSVVPIIIRGLPRQLSTFSDIQIIIYIICI